MRATLSLLLLFGLANAAQAYVGPGVGLGALGVVLGVVGGVLLAIFGLFWYPIKRMFKRSAGEPEIVLESEQTDAAAQSSNEASGQRSERASAEPS